MRRNLIQKKIVLPLLVLVVLGGLFAVPDVSFADHCSSLPLNQCNADSQCVVGAGGICQNTSGHGTPTCDPTQGQEYDPETGTCVQAEYVAGFEQAAGAVLGWLGDKTATAIFAGIGFLLITIGALILGIAGVVLELAIDLTIVKMSSIVSALDVINVAWTLIRDAANILFIFIILVIAIGTILQLQRYNMRSLLVRVIIAAILINFSLFITRVIIDASNLLAYEFYQPIAELSVEQEVPGADPNESGVQETRVSGLAGAFMNQLGVTEAYSKVTDGLPGAVRMVMTGIFYLILAFVFMAVAAFLLIRFVMFIILMITSPIAFLGELLPALKTQADSWWKNLINHAMWVPAFMLLITLSFLIVSSDSFNERFGGGSFADALTGDAGAMIVVFNFFVVIGFIMASLIIAKQFGTSGAPKIVNKAAGMLTFGAAATAGRQTLGRLGRNVAKSDAVKQLAGSDNVFARMAGTGLRVGGERVGKASFDARAAQAGKDLGLGEAAKGGVAAGIESREKRRKKYEKEGKEATEARAKKKEERREEQEYMRKRRGLQSRIDALKTEEEEYRTRARTPTLDRNASKVRGEWKEVVDGPLKELEQQRAAQTGKLEEEARRVVGIAAGKLSPEEATRARDAAPRMKELAPLEERERDGVLDEESTKRIKKLREELNKLGLTGDQTTYAEALNSLDSAQKQVGAALSNRIQNAADQLAAGSAIDQKVSKEMRKKATQTPEQKDLFKALKKEVEKMKKEGGEGENKKKEE